MTTEPLFDTGDFRKVCGHFPTGVTAVTARTTDGRVAALTVNSFTSVSLEPAKVLFCLATTSSSYTVLQEADRVAIHILGQDQEDIARRFATSGLTGTHKLEGTGWTPGPDGVPLIPGTPAVLAGRVDQAISSGDHIIFLIDVDHVGLKESATPALSFYRGRFATPATAVRE
jgi:flavin reductase (DIM6/NTAB) family NADH-FMN oxidoreductase RutF